VVRGDAATAQLGEAAVGVRDADAGPSREAFDQGAGSATFVPSRAAPSAQSPAATRPSASVR